MVKHCRAFGFTNRSEKAECKDLSWHSLPLGNKKLLAEWLVKIRRDNTPVSKHPYICGSILHLNVLLSRLEDRGFVWSQDLFLQSSLSRYKSQRLRVRVRCIGSEHRTEDSFEARICSNKVRFDGRSRHHLTQGLVDHHVTILSHCLLKAHHQK